LNQKIGTRKELLILLLKLNAICEEERTMSSGKSKSQSNRNGVRRMVIEK
jgi:hypothetical protein